jgi:hypothetical protein
MCRLSRQGNWPRRLKDDDACTLAGTAEHAGRAGADDACDDGRAGK